MEHIFVGFGFGPIQGGLFVNEAFRSGNFSRIVLAEIDQALVDAVRANNGSYFVNVAKADCIEAVKIDNIELLNPNNNEHRKILLDALAQSTEIATSLPSVSFYSTGANNSVAAIIAEGLQKNTAPATIIYTAENNNRAAEILEQKVKEKTATPPQHRVQYLNTVIGKMSQVVTDPSKIAQMKLSPIAPGIKRAFLVEEFNHILATRCRLENFRPGIEVFIEKDELIPFEEAKLYGHNAIHALLAYLGAIKGYTKMTELKKDAAIMKIAEEAFLNESGASLIRKYSNLGDSLFTQAGYRAYAEDLLNRITNPYLEDTTARAGRDIVRKLAYNDRIFGTMVVALSQGIEPPNMALGAIAGVAALFNPAWENHLPNEISAEKWQQLSNEEIKNILLWLWNRKTDEYTDRIIQLTQQALPRLIPLTVK